MAKKPARNSACPCGSTLKYKHCCGGANNVSPTQTGTFQQELQSGWELHQHGQLDQALHIYQRLLESNPDDAKLLYLTGAIHHSQNNLESAFQYIEKGIKKGMNDPAAFYQYSELLTHRHEYDRAITFLLKSLKKRPVFFEAEKLLANIYFETEQFSNAETHYRKALIINERDYSVHHNLAKTLRKRNRDADAIRHYEKSYQLNSESIDTLLAIADTLEQNNRLDEAEHFSKIILEKQPHQFNSLMTLSKIYFRKKIYAEALKFLDAIPIDAIPEQNQIEVLSQKALILDKKGDFSSALETQNTAKNRTHAIRSSFFSKTQFLQKLESLEQQTRLYNFPLSPGTAKTKRSIIKPIFVVGFFRSGTTLVHQILGSHPNVIGAGELNFIEQLEQTLISEVGENYLTALQTMPTSKREKIISKLRSSYISMANIVAGNYNKQNAQFIVDKYPFNILNLPIIELIFPDAPIIHMARNPIDTVISCFFTSFQDKYSWADSLEDSAEVYAIVHTHAYKILNEVKPELYTLKYEDLVSHLDTEVKSLLEFIGLAWDEGCLSFHQNANIPRTPSYAQVTEKIYTSSTTRAEHYSAYIPRSVFTTLDSAIQSLGYTTTTHAAPE